MPDATFEDRFLIREVYGRYALGAGLQDVEAWIACWAEDATWKTPHFEVKGHPALRETWDMTWTDFANVAAFNEVGAIVVSGDTAKTSSAVLEIIQLKSGGILKMAGIYHDDLVRRAGEWRFARRDYQLMSVEPAA